MLPGPAVPGCCWIFLYFLLGKLSTRTVYTVTELWIWCQQTPIRDQLGHPEIKLCHFPLCFVRCQPCSESSLIIQISIKLPEKVLYSSLTSFLPSCRYNHDWRGIWNETCWRGRREKVSATYLALPPTIDLQVDSGGRGLWLGWLWFGYSNILLSCPVDSAKFSTAQAETGRQRNDQYHSQPNPVRDGATTMVILYCVCLMISFPRSIW